MLDNTTEKRHSTACTYMYVRINASRVAKYSCRFPLSEEVCKCVLRQRTTRLTIASHSR